MVAPCLPRSQFVKPIEIRQRRFILFHTDSRQRRFPGAGAGRGIDDDGAFGLEHLAQIGEDAGADFGPPYPAASVDARADQEARRPRIGRTVDAGGIGKRRDAGIAALPPNPTTIPAS